MGFPNLYPSAVDTKLKSEASCVGENIPVIQVINGELHLTTDQAEQAIIDAGVSIYQRGANLVRPIHQEVSASKGRTTISAALDELTVHSLVDILCRFARFERFDGRSKDWVRINAPSSVAQILLSRHGSWRVPSVVGVITTPTLRPDGSVLSEPGYDRATKLYHVADPTLQLAEEVHAPSRGAAEGALVALDSLLTEFPFVDDASRTVALSALITPVVRGALSVTPLHVFRASTAGSGKSYLADIASTIPTGRPCPVISAGQDDAETEKRLAGLLLAGYPLISIDNVNGELGGDLLCQALERPFIRLRKLGGSDITEIESAATIFVTGNNARVRGDMVRRTLIADLDPKQERPELRRFSSDPVATVLADRGRYVSACLTIVRAYIEAACPAAPPPLGSFGEWSRLVRGALIWLGRSDPVATMEKAREDDPEIAKIREVMTCWYEALGSEEIAASEIASRIEEREPTRMVGEPTDFAQPKLRETLLSHFGARGSLNTRIFGNWLAQIENRIVDGRRAVRSQRKFRTGATLWRVERA